MKDRIPIEDSFEDVLSKAMRGLGLRIEEVADRTNLTVAKIQGLLTGKYDETAARQLASALSLSDTCLHRLANKAERPTVALPAGICLHNTPFPVPGYEQMTVNSYSVVPPEQLEVGFLIDAGSCFESVLNETDQMSTFSWSLFLTHTHADHIENFSQLSRLAKCAHAPVGEPYKDAMPVKEGDLFQFGHWQLKALGTAGHSPAGTSYLLEGGERPVVFVGDALFCYSIGKVSDGYESALSQIKEKILSLPKDTILCPGHGPLTTVEFENENNPFFA